MRTFLIFPAICSANDLSEFQLHARIITRVFRGAERMIGYRGERACPTMNSYFATRFSRYDHRDGGILAELLRVGRDAALSSHPPDIALCRASRLAKILTSRTQINPVPHAGASSFLPRTSPTVCARWRIASPLLIHSAPRVARSLSMSLSVAMRLLLSPFVSSFATLVSETRSQAEVLATIRFLTGRPRGMIDHQ